MRVFTHLAALVALATVGFAVGDWASHTNALGAVGILLLITAFAFLLSYLYRPTGTPAPARDKPPKAPRRRLGRVPAAAGAGGWDAAEAQVSRSRRRGSPKAGDDPRVDLNRAGAAELANLPGVGPVAAQRIVEERTANGAFATVSDLARVPGFNPAKVRALSDQARV